ncbi:lipopolysaccharide biosynthesis protein [Balneola sp. MJW-20]|uniref:lipopolysaccharide biosynthesis protein n=1 Tax=Gracilimonas aurantiaca TaxID=3234185 RepID=UPI00346575C4
MREELLNRFPEDIRNVLTLMIGNGLALSIPVLISPVLTRIYSVDDFAYYTVFAAMVGFISAFASGRYEYAILIAKSRNAAIQLFKLSVLVLVILSLILMIVLVVFREAITEVFGISGIGLLVYLVPVNIIIFSLIRISGNGLNREKDYSSISTGKSVKAITTGGGQLLIGFTGWLPGGLILGKIAGDLLSAAYLTIKLDKAFHYIRNKFLVKRTAFLAQKHKRYPQINAFHALLNASSNNAIPLIIGALFSQEIVGWFGLSFMICMAPVQLLGTAAYQVYSQKISVLFNSGESLNAYTLKTIKTLGKIAVIPFSLLLAFGPKLFSLILGEEWYASGEYAQILAPYLFVGFLLSPLTYLPLVFNEHKKALYFEILSTSFKILSILGGAYLGSIYTALLLFSGSGIIIHLVTLAWILNLTRRSSS